MTGERTRRRFARAAPLERRGRFASPGRSGRVFAHSALWLIGTAVAAAVLCADGAGALEVVGAASARFTWEPASGPVAAYLVYVSRNGEPFPQFPEQFSYEPRADVAGAAGDTVVIGVAALGPGATVGPLSQLSYPVHFATQPSPPEIGVSTSALFLSATPGFEPPAPSISVVNSGGGSLYFAVSTFPTWLQASPAFAISAMADVRVRLGFDTSALAPGVHYAAVTVRAAGVAQPAVIPVILTVLDPIPTFSLSSGRISVSAPLGGAPQEALASLRSSVAGAAYSINTDADWIHPASDGGIASAGEDTLAIELDPAGLARGAHSGHLYVIPADSRAGILTAEVTLTVRDPLAPPRIGPDLSGDGRADLVWRDTATGSVQLWLMSGAVRLGHTQLFGPLPASEWSLVAIADLDGDRRADLVWQNTRSGQAVVWFMNGLVRVRTATLPTPPAGARIAAADDVDGDGRADLVLHDAASGALGIWLMQGSTRTAVLAPNLGGELVAAVVGSGDFDASGTADLVWRTPGGGMRLWISRNGGPGEGVALESPPESGWAVAAVADLGGDGKSDLVWRNDLLRESRLWRFESPTVIDTGVLPDMRYPGWMLAAAADFDGDGKGDLVWRNTGTGQATLWLMDGFARRQGASLATPPPPSWNLVH